MQLLVGIAVAEPVQLLGFAALAALAFTAIIQAPVALFGNRGWILALLLLVIQVAATGVPLTGSPRRPDPSRRLAPFMPLTRAIDAFQGALAGGRSNLAIDAVVLGAWLLGGILVALAVAAGLGQRGTDGGSRDEVQPRPGEERPAGRRVTTRSVALYATFAGTRPADAGSQPGPWLVRHVCRHASGGCRVTTRSVASYATFAGTCPADAGLRGLERYDRSSGPPDPQHPGPRSVTRHEAACRTGPVRPSPGPVAPSATGPRGNAAPGPTQASVARNAETRSKTDLQDRRRSRSRCGGSPPCPARCPA